MKNSTLQSPSSAMEMNSGPSTALGAALGLFCTADLLAAVLQEVISRKGAEVGRAPRSHSMPSKSQSPMLATWELALAEVSISSHWPCCMSLPTPRPCRAASTTCFCQVVAASGTTTTSVLQACRDAPTFSSTPSRSNSRWSPRGSAFLKDARALPPTCLTIRPLSRMSWRLSLAAMASNTSAMVASAGTRRRTSSPEMACCTETSTSVSSAATGSLMMSEASLAASVSKSSSLSEASLAASASKSSSAMARRAASMLMAARRPSRSASASRPSACNSLGGASSAAAGALAVHGARPPRTPRSSARGSFSTAGAAVPVSPSLLIHDFFKTCFGGLKALFVVISSSLWATLSMFRRFLITLGVFSGQSLRVVGPAASARASSAAVSSAREAESSEPQGARAASPSPAAASAAASAAFFRASTSAKRPDGAPLGTCLGSPRASTSRRLPSLSMSL
mmetsp:Transcript_64974/g.203576  ORF Transcript_64974/g.203576 Transcript_64974/m.203576 type:complete len:453 (-) Transcript_64974:1044-2402(-)